MEALKFDIPWHKIEGESGLPKELYREVGPKHILFNKKVIAIARRQDRDDVLFHIEESGQYAVVHITWHQEKDPAWPDTIIYDTIEKVQRRIDYDVKDWVDSENAPLNEIGGFVKGMKRIIIVGASSGIGKELAKQYAIVGNVVAITARREGLLEEISQSYGGRMIYSVFDVTKGNNAGHLEDLVQRLQGLDILIYCSGLGEASKELNWELDKAIVETNVNGFVEVANWGFNYFTRQGHGSLVTISSIAANRGNSWAPAYSASKSFQSNYFEALAIKAYRMKKKISITCIEPGFVDTDMVRGYKRFWMVPLVEAAKLIRDAIEQKKRKAYISKRWWLIAKLMRWAPFWFYKRFG